MPWGLLTVRLESALAAWIWARMNHAKTLGVILVLLEGECIRAVGYLDGRLLMNRLLLVNVLLLVNGRLLVDWRTVRSLNTDCGNVAQGLLLVIAVERDKG